MPFFFKSAPGTFLWPSNLDQDELELADTITNLVAQFAHGKLTTDQWPTWTLNDASQLPDPMN